jgi:hypothetical protein
VALDHADTVGLAGPDAPWLGKLCARQKLRSAEGNTRPHRHLRKPQVPAVCQGMCQLWRPIHKKSHRGLHAQALRRGPHADQRDLRKLVTVRWRPDDRVRRDKKMQRGAAER